MKILFLDQSGKLGGAELSLADVANHHRHACQVALLQDGPFRKLLEDRQVPVQVLQAHLPPVRKDSGLLSALGSLGSLGPLVSQTRRLSRGYDVIYANTPKALVVGALAGVFSQRPVVYHLRDIISADHFSAPNRKLLITLANRFTVQIIANSEATQAAFIAAGGDPKKVCVVYNGFDAAQYNLEPSNPSSSMRQTLGLQDKFVVGHFSRLAPWKGQHVLIEALTQCPDKVVALFVGDALFGEDDYVADLHQQVNQLNLSHRVHFLGFRNDVPELMQACNLITHTSTAPEPFGRVIVEAMLCQRPIIASAAGGAVELIDHGQTGWLCPPDAPDQLAALINQCQAQPDLAHRIVDKAYGMAQQKFAIATVNRKIDSILHTALEAV